MQASLCLRTAGPSARIQHCPLALCQASSVLLRRHCQVALNFSPVFRTDLRAGPGRMPINHAIQVHMTPPENGIGKKKAEEERRGTVKSVAAAVVLACTLGAMCTNWKARADDRGLLSWRFSRPQITSGDAPPSTPGDAPSSTSTQITTLTKSIQALQAVLDLKYEPGLQKPAPAVPRKLLDLLDETLPPNDQSELKTCINQLKKGDQKPDAVINLLYKEWKEKTQISEGEYNLGLVLIDLLINQGEYKKAEDVCQKVEPLASSSDVRAKIRRRTAAKLEMSGKEDEAVEMLREAWEKAEKDGKMHEAYELEMLLVEMLIYKGDYQEALKCKCLNDKEISDARGPLYQAIIYLIEDDIIRAKQCYEEFQDIRSRFHWPDAIKEGSPLYGVVHDFQVFERIVRNLKKEIELAHMTKKVYKAKV